MEISIEDVFCWVNVKNVNNALYDEYLVQTDGGWIFKDNGGLDSIVLPPKSLDGFVKVKTDSCICIDELLKKYEIIYMPSANDHVNGGVETVMALVKKVC